MRVNGMPVEYYLARENQEPLKKRCWCHGRHNQERVPIRVAKRVWAWAQLWWSGVLYR